jgi:hypothetical protein
MIRIMNHKQLALISSRIVALSGDRPAVSAAARNSPLMSIASPTVLRQPHV